MKFKKHHIYIASVINTSVICLITLRLTDGCMASLALFGCVGSTTIMLIITNIFNDRIDYKERTSDQKNEDEN